MTRCDNLIFKRVSVWHLNMPPKNEGTFSLVCNEKLLLICYYKYVVTTIML